MTNEELLKVYSKDAAVEKAYEDHLRGYEGYSAAAKKRQKNYDYYGYEGKLLAQFDQVYLDTRKALKDKAKRRKAFKSSLYSHHVDLEEELLKNGATKEEVEESLKWIKDNLVSIALEVKEDVWDDVRTRELYLEELDREFPSAKAVINYENEEYISRGSVGNGFVATFAADSLKTCPKVLYTLPVTKYRLFAKAGEESSEIVPLFGDTRIKTLTEVSCNQFAYALLDLGYSLGKNK